MVQVTCKVADGKPRRLKLFQRKIKQPHIVGLETKHSARHQYLPVAFQKQPVRQAPFGVPFFRPWVAEIQINAINTVRGKPLGDRFRIADKKPQVVGAGIGTVTRFFQRETRHIRYAFHRDQVDLRVRRRHAAGKVAFATADFQMYRAPFGESRAGVAVQRFRMLDQKRRAGGNPLRPVLFLAGAHQTLKRKTTMSPSCIT